MSSIERSILLIHVQNSTCLHNDHRITNILNPLPFSFNDIISILSADFSVANMKAEREFILEEQKAAAARTGVGESIALYFMC